MTLTASVGPGFGATQGVSTIKYNGATMVVTSWNATTIVAKLPLPIVSFGTVIVNLGANQYQSPTYYVVPTLAKADASIIVPMPFYTFLDPSLLPKMPGALHRALLGMTNIHRGKPSHQGKPVKLTASVRKGSSDAANIKTMYEGDDTLLFADGEEFWLMTFMDGCKWDRQAVQGDQRFYLITLSLAVLIQPFRFNGTFAMFQGGGWWAWPTGS